MQVRRFAAVSIALLALFVVTQPAQGQTFTVLYSLQGGTDGTYPYGGVVQDSAGNLYGTTYYGGVSNFGTVFKVSSTGTETLLHSFLGASEFPAIGLTLDRRGNLYGTTGGSTNSHPTFGSVFMIDRHGKGNILHLFAGWPTDGAYPEAQLVGDSAGNLYGATNGGGAFNGGTVFKLDQSSTVTILHSFGDGTDGESPISIMRDLAGNIYGTTPNGGTWGFGTVFKIDPNGNESVLYNFTGGIDGGSPVAGVIRDAAGNLYGTTNTGGAFNVGTIFMLDANGNEQVLHSFAGGAEDGAYPHAGVIRDDGQNLYGTTFAGGTSGMGTVFKLDAHGDMTLLHSFSGTPDGQYPNGGLITDAAGNFYGTTNVGGTASVGIVFKLTP